VTSFHRLRLRAAVLGIALAAQQAAAQAVTEPPAAAPQAAERRIPRRILLPIIMATAAAVAASVYFVSDADEAVGSYVSPGCVLPFTIGAGLAVGYLMGREVDQAHALRYRQGAPVFTPGEQLRLEGEPQWMSIGDRLGAAGGAGGVHLFSTRGAPRVLARRATSIRGLRAVEIGDRFVAVASATGLYEFAVDSAMGERRRDGDISAMTSVRGRRVVGIGDRVELEPGAGARDTAWTHRALGAPVRAMTTDAHSGVLWVATDSALVALSVVSDSLVQRSSTRLRGGARSVRTDGTRVVVASGERGLWLFDLDGTTARERFVWAGARFAYDALITRERLYVAGGGEGLYVLDARAPRGVVLGLARQVGFAVALGERGDYTYVLDRTAPAVHRIRSDFPLR
jgi:hypothetical protein